MELDETEFMEKDKNDVSPRLQNVDCFRDYNSDKPDNVREPKHQELSSSITGRVLINK